MKIIYFFLFISCICLNGCFKQKRKGKIEAAHIYRKSDEHFYIKESGQKAEKKLYFWSQRYVGNLITKEFFRCKGSSVHPLIIGKQILSDCNGAHSLPLKEGKEHIYPILMQLLNYIQEKTKKEVVITTGHRCPKHNQYADASNYNAASLHMIGAEVDFYVLGMEEKCHEIVEMIKQYYHEDKEVNKDSDYITFKRYTQKNVNVRIEPWYNQEIFIKLYEADEGRDYDNQHPYPYISIQIRYDRQRKEKVRFNHEQAERLLHETS